MAEGKSGQVRAHHPGSGLTEGRNRSVDFASPAFTDSSGQQESHGLLLRKVCGLTRPQDAALCHELGFDFIGLIFAVRSPRRVTVEQARAIPDGHARRVGVFTEADAETILRTVEAARLDLVQLHGNQDEAVTARLSAALGADRLIRVFWPEREGRIALESAMARFAPLCGLYLLDAGSSGGGSGKAMDWSALATLRSPRPWLLAGGLKPNLLEEALCACRPAGLDLNSGLEDSPGMKNHDAVRRAAAILERYASGASQKESQP